MNRRRARVFALQALFQIDLGKADLETVLGQALAREPLPDDGLDPLPPQVQQYACDLVTACSRYRDEIDAAISALAKDWSLERMAAVDRNVLRLAVCELLFRGDEVPPGAVINEAVELAKLYSTAESGRFVNGILGTLLRQRQGDAAPAAVSKGDGSFPRA